MTFKNKTNLKLFPLNVYFLFAAWQCNSHTTVVARTFILCMSVLVGAFAFVTLSFIFPFAVLYRSARARCAPSLLCDSSFDFNVLRIGNFAIFTNTFFLLRFLFFDFFCFCTLQFCPSFCCTQHNYTKKKLNKEKWK